MTFPTRRNLAILLCIAITAACSGSGGDSAAPEPSGAVKIDAGNAAPIAGGVADAVFAIGGFDDVLLDVGSEITANLLTLGKHGDNPADSAAGASGAISGVLFSFCLFQPFAMLGIMLIIPMPAILFAVVYIVGSIYASQQGGGRIAHEAHLGGALGGLLLTIILEPAALPIFLGQLGL